MQVREMAAQRLAGLAIAPVGKGESVRLWQELRPGTPVVALNASVEGITGVSRVYPDNATGVELAMRRLAELGHSSAAFLSAPRGLAADTDRLRYFRRLAAELGIRPHVMRSPLTITDVRKAAGTLLTRRDAPTAIITNSDYTALGIYKIARDLSLRIGPDVSVIGHDDLPTSELLDPPLATICLDGREMGRALMADPDRLRHFRRLARQLGLRPRVMYSLLTIADVQRAAVTLLSSRDAPTAIITNSDYTAHAVYKAARELSLPVGPGISVIGHDDLPTSELLDPPLATIRMDQRAMGRALMMRLLEPGPPDDYIAGVELIQRASLQPPDMPRSGRAQRPR